jgi:anthranilate synthase/aminodeoxychorismate synthase-like glutamine amidotransferase
MNVLLIDNFDSFVYNLAQYLGELGAIPKVVRNDCSVEEIEALDPGAIVISPGPGRPEDAGCSVEVIQRFHGSVPILGVCLGHQAIGVAFGAQVVRADELMHGKTSQIHHSSEGVLSGLPNPFVATRYHSLVIDPATLPDELKVTAETERGTVMAVKHQKEFVEGVQFHPESVLTETGMQLMKNFLVGASATSLP